MGHAERDGTKVRGLDRLRPLLAFALLIGVLVVAGAQPAAAGISTPPPIWGKAFSPSTIGVGSTSVLTFTIDNTSNGVPVDDMAFSDTLPAGVVIAAVPGIANTCDGTVSAPAAGSTIALTGGRLAASSSCTISVNVVGNAVGTKTNLTGDLTSSLGNSGTATNDLVVDATLASFAKAFSPGTIPAGGTSTITFTITNPTGGTSPGVFEFADNLPAGLVVAPLPNAMNTCGGFFAPAAGATVVSLTGVLPAPNTSCTVNVDVTAAANGTFENVTGQLLTGFPFAVTPTGFATAVLDAPVQFLSKLFVDDPVAPGSTVPLRFTIQNPDRDFTASNITFTDDLNSVLAGLAPVGLPVNDVCGGGSTLSFAGGILTLANGTLAGSADCTFDVTLTVPGGTTPGDYTNTTSDITATIAGSPFTGNMATDILTVGAFPTFTKEFTNDPVGAGGTVTLEFTLTNPGPTAMTDLAFTDELSESVIQTAVNVNGGMSPAADVCGSGSSFSFTPFFDAGGGGGGGTNTPATLTLTGGQLAAAGSPGDSCTFFATLNIENDAPSGTYPNTTSTITGMAGSTSFEGPPATDTLVVEGAPSVVKTFTPDTVQPGGTTTLEFTISHSVNASADATGISFTDDLDAALTGLASTSGTLNDICGTGSSIAGTTSLSFTGGTLAPGASCTFSVTVQVPTGAAAGTATNTTSTPTATVGGVAVTGVPASDDLLVAILQFSKSFLNDPLPTGASSVDLQFTIQNVSATEAATAITFLDTLSGVIPSLDTGTPLPTTPCGPTSTLASVSQTLILISGELAAGATCTFTVPLTFSSSTPAGTYANLTSILTATIGGVTGAVQGVAADTLVIEDPLPVLLTKQFKDDIGSGGPALPGGSVDLEFTISNPNSSAVGSLAFTDDLNATLTDLASTSGTLNDICGTGSSITGTTSLSFTGGSLAGGANCSFTVNLSVPAGATPNDYVNTTTSLTGDLVGSPYGAATDTLTVAVPGPTVVVSTASPDPTNSSTINFTATFSEAVGGFATGDVTPAGTAGATTATITGGPTVFNIAVSGMTTDGTVAVAVPALAAFDLGTGTRPNQLSNTVTLDYDATKPDVTIDQGAAQADPTNVAAITFDVVFSEPVTGFGTADVTATNGTVTGVSGSGANYTVTVTAAADGVVTATIPAGGASDAAGNTNNASTSTDNSVTFDGTKPDVTINQGAAQADPTNVAAITFDVVFSEPVTGFGTADVTATNGTVTGVSGSGANYTVTVTAAADGVVTATIPAGGASDAAGNTNNASTSTDNSVTFDGTKPDVTINQGAAQADPTNVAAITFDVVFSEPVAGFGTADVTATNGTVTGVSGVGANYTVTVTAAADGVVTATIPAGGASDAAGNTNNASTSTDNSVLFDASKPDVTIDQGAAQADPTNVAAITFDVVFSETVTGFDPGDVTATNGTVTGVAGTGANYTVTVTAAADGVVTATIPAGGVVDAVGNTNNASTSTDNSVTFDGTKPDVTIDQGAGQADPTNNAAVTFDVVFSEPVTGFDPGDVTATNGTVTGVAGTGTTYTVSVTAAADGVVTATVNAGGATDAASNTNNASTSTDNSVTVDTTKPDVTINQGAGQADPTNNTAVTFDVVFSEPVTGFGVADVTATNGTVNSVSGTGTNYTVTVTAAADGVVTATIPAGGATDAAGNTNNASTSTDNSVTVDTTKPGVTINQGAGQADPTNNTAVTFDVVFSEPVTGFGVADVTATNGTVNSVSGTGTNYTVTVTAAADGVVTATIPAGGATDAAGNTNNASTSTDNSVTVDTTAPTINTPPGGVQTNNDPGQAGANVDYTVTADDPRTEATDEAVLAPGSPSCSPASGTFFPIGETTVTCTASDLAGNQSTATFTVTVTDNEPPVISGPTAPVPTVPGTNGTVDYDLPTVTDNSGATIPVTCDPPPGSVIPPGDQTITCTATDGSGNTTTFSFVLAVAPMSGLPATGGDTSTAQIGLYVLLAGLLLFGVSRMRRRRSVFVST